MVDQKNQHLAILKKLNLFVKQFKVQLLLHTLVNLLPWLTLLLVVGFYFKFSISFLVITFVLVNVFAVFIRIKSARYQQITLNDFLLHLNRKYPQLQESAQLFNGDNRSFSVLQTLQQNRVIIQLEPLLLDDKQSLLPKFSYQKSIVSAVFVSLVLLMFLFSAIWLSLLNTEDKGLTKIAELKDGSTKSSKELLLTHS